MTQLFNHSKTRAAFGSLIPVFTIMTILSGVDSGAQTIDARGATMPEWNVDGTEIDQLLRTWTQNRDTAEIKRLFRGGQQIEDVTFDHSAIQRARASADSAQHLAPLTPQYRPALSDQIEWEERHAPIIYWVGPGTTVSVRPKENLCV